ncbi:MAG: biopolymer transporter ExbD [Candidatus Eisenbacteria bacterium]|nr:biopolymer transporter ExbD [Candidatus Eisenbacteria bacterium]
MKIRKRAKGEPEIPNASMSDVAFLLLIFFLVTTIFNVEKGLDIVLPNLGTSPKRIAKQNLCEIRIAASGRVTVDGVETAVRGLEDVIRRRLIENDKTICVIETHPGSYYGIMVDVLDELKLAEATKITLRTGGGG